MRSQLIFLTGSLDSPQPLPEEEPSTREETEMASFDCANLTTGHREAAREKDLQDQAQWHRQLWVLMNATYKNAGRGGSQGRQGGRF